MKLFKLEGISSEHLFHPLLEWVAQDGVQSGLSIPVAGDCIPPGQPVPVWEDSHGESQPLLRFCLSSVLFCWVLSLLETTLAGILGRNVM